jgi:hypothetical protein
MTGKVLRCGWWMMVALAVVAQGAAALADTGTITISECIIREKDEENAISSGFADADLSVYFESEASCSCGCEDLEYEWDFGDSTTSTGKDVSHVYGTTGAGDRSITLTVECTECGATATDSSLSVSAISGIEVQYVGEDDDNDRLCFNDHVDCEAAALPAGIADGAHDLIDWSLQIGSYILDKPNDRDPAMTLEEANWPTSNSAWGEITLYVLIDSLLVDGQDDELITGSASFLSDSKTVEKFFDEEGDQNPDPDNAPNWFHYWKQTDAYHGTVGYDGTRATGHSPFDGNAWRAYLGTSCNESSGSGTWNNAEGIDYFAHYCRHEDRHRLDSIALWGAGTNRDPAKDTDGDWLPDDQEAGLVAGHPYDNTKYGTYADTFNYGENPLRDCEDYCLRRQQGWNAGDADDEDWAHPGHQWP